MADASDTNASPRLRKRHQRYAQFSRLNHNKQELSFLTAQATRLGTTAAAIFGALDSYTTDQVLAATSKSQIGL
jgi:hypothetical protein